MGRVTLYQALNLAELWALRVLTLAAVWGALELFVPTATGIEILWTEVAFVGLVYACKTLALRWDIEQLRRRRGLNGELRLISHGHLVLRGIGVGMQALSLTAGVVALAVEEPAHQDVTVLALITTLALIGVGLLAALGCWYAEHNLAQQLSYRQAVEALHGVPVMEEGVPG